MKQQAKNDRLNTKYHRILDAAIKVLAEEGFHKATISQIAGEAGVADGTIYLYFKNKADILSHIFDYKSRIVFDGFREAIDQSDKAEDKLRNLIHRHLAEFQRDRNMAVVFQREALQTRYVNNQEVKDITKMYMDILDRIIRQGKDEGTFRLEVTPGLATRFILGAVNEVINSWVVSGGRKDLVEMADPLVEFFLKGIGSENT